jgi:hypothetical protein
MPPKSFVALLGAALNTVTIGRLPTALGVTSIHGLPNETHDECCAVYDEWYVFEQPVLPGEIEVFVNWLGFRLYDPDFKWCADRLWEQMTRLAPESYVGDGSVFTFATRNGALFTRVLSAFSASAE